MYVSFSNLYDLWERMAKVVNTPSKSSASITPVIDILFNWLLSSLIFTSNLRSIWSHTVSRFVLFNINLLWIHPGYSGWGIVWGVNVWLLI